MPGGRAVRVLAGGAAFVLVAGCLPVTVERLLGGTGDARRALLAALVPWTLPVLLLAVVLVLVAHGRRPAPLRTALAAVPVLVLLVHAVWVGPSVLPNGGPDGGTSLRVLALNLEFGEADAEQVVDVVRREEVDVLVALELTPESVRALQRAGLEDVLDAAVLAPDRRAAGSGVWARVPLEPVDELPGTLFRTPRAWAVLPDGGRVLVTAAHPHPPLDATGWERDLGLLTAAVRAGAGEPQVVAGDFNATRDHEPFRRLLAAGLKDVADVAGATAWPGMTWPADRAFPPVMRLDHVLMSPRLGATDVGTVRVDGTDHLGVLATVVVPPS